MKIAIFGMGYVGCVSAACLADMGHDVTGVEINPQKLQMLRDGKSPIIEPGLDDLLEKTVRTGKLTVTDDATAAFHGSDISLICVGTPSRQNGSLDTKYIYRVVEQIGAALRDIDHYHVVTIRSTLLPGVVKEAIVPLLEQASGKKAGDDFGVCVNPEFLRESSAITDFRNPPFTVIGEFDQRSGDLVAKIYESLPGEIYRTEPDAASMVKYASNAFHALKVIFANEIGALCRELGIDSQQVMHIFVQDKSLNISPMYLRPGFAFGGSCLPKDVRALHYVSQHRDVETPVLSAILPSNDKHIKRALDVVLAQGKRNVAMIGLSFKPGTDDLRESPQVRLAETLIGKGYNLQVFDEEVSLSSLFGKNREYIEQVLPHINSLMQTDLEQVIEQAEVIIITKRMPVLDSIRGKVREDQLILDLDHTGDWSPAKKVSIV